MSTRKWVVLIAAWAVTSLACAQDQPYQHLLADEDAKKAEALQARIDELWATGKFMEAGPAAEELRALRQRVQGENHWEAADAARLVVTLRQAAALPAEQRAGLAAGPSTTAKAEALYSKGQYAEAEPLFRKAVAVWDKTLGPRHSDTATAYNNLAVNLDLLGRFQEAEPLSRKALAVRAEVLGPRHPSTAESHYNLAVILQDQGRTLEAEPLVRKALAVYEEVLGPRHPNTAATYNNLALTLQAQGRAKEAEPLVRKALVVRAEVLGPRHRDTALGYNELAYNLHAQGRFQEAEALYRQTLAIWQDVLSPRHPDTAAALNNLAANLRDQGRVKEAEPLLRTALAICEEVHGPRHPSTANSYNTLAYNLDGQGRYKEAEPLYRKAVAVREEFLGSRHPSTARSYNNLAVNLDAQGRTLEAEPLKRKALAMWTEILGPRHPDTAFAANNLAVNLQAQGRAQEAEPLWQAAVDGIEGARLRLAASTLDKAAAVRIQPHSGLAACRARLGRAAEAWTAAEAGLARGLLDDLATRVTLPADPAVEAADRARAARLNVLDRSLTPLLTAEKLDEVARRRRDELLKERAALDNEVARAAAEQSRQAVLPLTAIQDRLAADDALVFWVDIKESGDHWGCVVRRRGTPTWVRLSGSGPGGAWTAADHDLPRRLRDELARGEPDADRHADRLAAQRLAPLAPHLAASAELPAVRHLIVVPAGRMAAAPVEALTDRFLVSYAPSGSVFARLRSQHRPLESPRLLALGDPNFTLVDAGSTLKPPDYGLYVFLVLPGGGSLRAGDILLNYGGNKLVTKSDLKIAEGGESVPVVVWRDGKTLGNLRVAPGKLGVVLSSDPPAIAFRTRHNLDLLADARIRSNDARPLPGTRLEVAAIAGLLPEGRSTLLLGSKASEQELDTLAAAGKLKQFQLLHLATHGTVDPVAAARSALLLARDQLPDPAEQDRLRAAGKKIPTGRLSVAAIADEWNLDADLVALSACQTALGPEGGGEGLLGFSQVLLGRGARSLLLSLWKVDDTATALLMTRFYENLLGKRAGLKAPLAKALALQEAKQWLRGLARAEVEKLAARLSAGELRGSEGTLRPRAPAPDSGAKSERPYTHPCYWAAFILIGDPD